MSFQLLTALTRRLAQVHLTTTITTSSSWKLTATAIPTLQSRSFAQKKSGRSSEKKKEKKRSPKTLQKEVYNEQHKEWVKFQKTLQVDGVETGQTLSVTQSAMTGIKSRGGKSVRRRMEKLMAPEKAKYESEKRLEQSGGGLYPPLRYADDETQRLLQEAHENIPKRTGKRGTRHLKRMKNRQFLIRKARSLQKFFKIRAHFRKMKRRSQVVANILQVKEDTPEVVRREKEYQQLVLQRWAEVVMGKDLNTLEAGEIKNDSA